MLPIARKKADQKILSVIFNKLFKKKEIRGGGNKKE